MYEYKALESQSPIGNGQNKTTVVFGLKMRRVYCSVDVPYHDGLEILYGVLELCEHALIRRAML